HPDPDRGDESTQSPRLRRSSSAGTHDDPFPPRGCRTSQARVAPDPRRPAAGFVECRSLAATRRWLHAKGEVALTPSPRATSPNRWPDSGGIVVEQVGLLLAGDVVLE